MKIQKTKKQAIQYHSDIMQMKGTIYEHYFASKNRQFDNDNRITINGILDEMNTLHAAYFEMEKGKIVRVENKPVFLEGKTNEEYVKAWEELMGQQVMMVV